MSDSNGVNESLLCAMSSKDRVMWLHLLALRIFPSSPVCDALRRHIAGEIVDWESVQAAAKLAKDTAIAEAYAAVADVKLAAWTVAWVMEIAWAAADSARTSSTDPARSARTAFAAAGAAVNLRRDMVGDWPFAERLAQIADYRNILDGTR